MYIVSQLSKLYTKYTDLLAKQNRFQKRFVNPPTVHEISIRQIITSMKTVHYKGYIRNNSYNSIDY